MERGGKSGRLRKTPLRATHAFVNNGQGRVDGAAEPVPRQLRHGQGRVDGSSRGVIVPESSGSGGGSSSMTTTAPTATTQSSARLIAASHRLTAARVPGEPSHRRTRASRPQRVRHREQQRRSTPRSCRRDLAPCHLQRRPRRPVLLRVHAAACSPAVHVVAPVRRPPPANVVQALVDKLNAPPVDRVEHVRHARCGEPVQQPLPSAGASVRAVRMAVCAQGRAPCTSAWRKLAMASS